jgi:hypothetical protein
MMGNDFFLIGYRVFVRFKNSKNKILRGLYILKSETDQKKMQFFGNLFTHYNYTTTDITMVENQESLEIRSEKSNFYIQLSKEFNNVDLPKNSPFSEWKEARRFAGPLPFTFTYDDKKKEVLVIEGVRSNWKPRAINVIDHDFEFIKSMGFQGAVLASAFVINDIPYSWKSGKIESWKKP